MGRTWEKVRPMWFLGLLHLGAVVSGRGLFVLYLERDFQFSAERVCERF
jgi:hypothetical protein